MRGPIEKAWQEVLDRAPNEHERAKAENWSVLFYAGASALWQLVRQEIDDEALSLRIEVDLESYRQKLKQLVERQ